MKRLDFITETKTEPKHIKIFDGVFKYTTFSGDAVCDLRVFTFGRTIMGIAKERHDNTAASITNGSENLWLNVIKEFGDGEFFETYDNLRFDSVEIIRGKAKWSQCVGDLEILLRSLK